MLAMEKEFDSKLVLSQENGGNGGNFSRSKSFSFKAPQENFTIHDFKLGIICGVGSYSKVFRTKKKESGTVYALRLWTKKSSPRTTKLLMSNSRGLFLINLNIMGSSNCSSHFKTHSH